jgi:hypothetical protein
MSDWADEEAARLSNLDRDTREESQWVCDQIASALRSAFHRGKVEEREACAKVCERVYGVYVDDSNARTAGPLIIECAVEIRSRAEQENKP